MNDALIILFSLLASIAYFEVRLANSKPPQAPEPTPTTTSARLNSSDPTGKSTPKDTSVTLMTDDRDDRILGGED